MADGFALKLMSTADLASASIPLLHALALGSPRSKTWMIGRWPNSAVSCLYMDVVATETPSNVVVAFVWVTTITGERTPVLQGPATENADTPSGGPSATRKTKGANALPIDILPRRPRTFGLRFSRR